MPRYLILLFLYLFMAGCASPRLDSTLSHPDWEISGKIGVRENALRTTTSIFQWRQQDRHYAIFLSNSMGQVQLTITGDDKKATAHEPNGRITRARTPEELLEKLTGWYFPVTAARHWLQGRTLGSETDIRHSDNGLLAQFNTREWQASLNNYKAVDGVFLPHKIRLDQEKLSITLIVKQHAYFMP